MSALQFKGSPRAPEPKFVSNAGASGDTTLVSGVAAKQIKVYGMRLSAAAAVTVSVKDGAGTVLEAFNFGAAGGSAILKLRDDTYYETTAGNALLMACSAAVQVSGVVEYVQF